ncbi:uncharacterized protein LOC141909161 [Tubulanus polymorphus]|uniref:uncharacterized protein LOC141909161 n=1 Tax=Tubulanus polymorphus TaxID=672921 RepID=UPI003DA64314
MISPESKKLKNDDSWTCSYERDDKKKVITYKELIGTIMNTRRGTIDWFMDRNLIAASRQCPVCNDEMKLSLDISNKSASEGWRWSCRKRVDSVLHQRFKSVRADSWFSKSNLTIAEILEITYWLSRGVQQTVIQTEMGLSSKTIVDWASFFREVCELVVFYNCKAIGGPGKVVVIDESKFGKRKFNRGRCVDGQWVFGGIERGNNKNVFMVSVDKRDSDTLIPIIEKWILPGTTIMSDCWEAYSCLNQRGFEHLTVNHSVTFVDPDTNACTNLIEISGYMLKRISRSTAQ